MENKPKTKKVIIAEFLEISIETDQKKAFQDYVTGMKSAGVPEEAIASHGLFHKVWIEVKGRSTKTEKTEKNRDETRANINEMYKEQFKMINAYHVSKISALLTQDPITKKEFLLAAERSIDSAAIYNRTIRDYMEKNDF